MSKITAAITGVGGFVPEYILTNQELEKMVETSDEWITARTGIKERRILKGKDQGVSVLGIGAVRNLIEKTGLNPEEVDLLIFATTTPDMVFPATANIVAAACGMTNAFSYDISAACSGFLYALNTGAQFIESGKFKKVVVIGGDKMSSIIDYEDRATCIIFGDGAGAVLLEPNTEGNGVIDSYLRSDGNGWVHLHQKAGGSKRPPTQETVLNKEHFVYQEGQTVFKFAVTNMADACTKIMEKNQLTAADVTWLVPHQANLRIIDYTAEKMELPKEKVMINIHKFGNTTSGTIPLCLWEWESRLKKGDVLILAAFGGGFTWGSTYIRWAYDSQ